MYRRNFRIGVFLRSGLSMTRCWHPKQTKQEGSKLLFSYFVFLDKTMSGMDSMSNFEEYN